MRGRSYKMVLELDGLDYAAIQKAMARRQMLGRTPDSIGSVLPKGRSSLSGALIAEIARGWIEFLDFSEGETTNE